MGRDGRPFFWRSVSMVIKMNIKDLTVQQVQNMYLDRVNNFLTNDKFAEYYGLHITEANVILEKGALIHETFASLYQELKCLNQLK